MCSVFKARTMQGLMALVTGVILLTAFYLQYTEALLPCPLCLMQRGMTVGLLLLAILGFLLKRLANSRLILGGELFFALAGAFFALRQLWLEHLPMPETGMCMPGVEHLLHKLPWHEVLHAFIWGSATSCGEVSWSFLGASMAMWSLTYFLLMLLMVCVGLVKRFTL